MCRSVHATVACACSGTGHHRHPVCLSVYATVACACVGLLGTNPDELNPMCCRPAGISTSGDVDTNALVRRLLKWVPADTPLSWGRPTGCFPPLKKEGKLFNKTNNVLECGHEGRCGATGCLLLRPLRPVTDTMNCATPSLLWARFKH